PLLEPRQSPPGGPGRERTRLAGTDPGHGGGADGPPMDPPRPPVLPRATARLGRSQAAWPAAEAGPAPAHAPGSLTPVPCRAIAPPGPLTLPADVTALVGDVPHLPTNTDRSLQ